MVDVIVGRDVVLDHLALTAAIEGNDVDSKSGSDTKSDVSNAYRNSIRLTTAGRPLASCCDADTTESKMNSPNFGATSASLRTKLTHPGAAQHDIVVQHRRQMWQRRLHREVDNKLYVTTLANVTDGLVLRAPQLDETAVSLRTWTARNWIYTVMEWNCVVTYSWQSGAQLERDNQGHAASLHWRTGHGENTEHIVVAALAIVEHLLAGTPDLVGPNVRQ